MVVILIIKVTKTVEVYEARAKVCADGGLRIHSNEETIEINNLF